MRCLVAAAILLLAPLAGLATPLHAVEAPISHGGQLAQASQPPAEWQPTPAQIREAQVRLKDLGFDPGTPDGVLGRRTTAAIQAYQRSINLEADGRLTEELHARLTGKPEETLAPIAATKPPEPKPPAGDCPRSSSGAWQFEDALGSSFALTLEDDGSVTGPSYPQHWHWRTGDQGIEIAYDNGMGLTVSRQGRLEDADHMAGEATDSRGRSWAWTAKRIPVSAQGENGNCKPGGSP
jgi:hypothetical protein